MHQIHVLGGRGSLSCGEEAKRVSDLRSPTATLQDLRPHRGGSATWEGEGTYRGGEGGGAWLDSASLATTPSDPGVEEELHCEEYGV